jgi:hypothetical protein
MTIELLTVKDLIFAPIFCFFLILITYYWSKHYYAHTSLKAYILPALCARMIGCVLAACMYHFYYHQQNDIDWYFYGSKVFHHAISEDALHGFRLLFSPISKYGQIDWEFLSQAKRHIVFSREDNVMVIRIGTFLSLLSFNSCLSIGLLMTYFSFLGCWKLFLTFYDLYPYFEKQIAFATLFIPSICFWGAAGLMKDTIIMAAIGYLIYTLYWIFIKRQPSLLHILQFIMSFLIIAIVKVFIAMILIPLICLWLFLQYHHLFQLWYQKTMVILLFLLFAIGFVHLISKNDRKFSLDKIASRSFRYQRMNLENATALNGSEYNLGVVDSSYIGLLKKFPIATVTAIVRPSLLDIKKAILLPAGIENFLLLLFICYCTFKIRYNYSSSLMLRFKPIIVFGLFFSIIVFFISGFTASSFGNLVRYRIVGLPFFVIGLFVISHDPPAAKSSFAAEQEKLSIDDKTQS